MNSFLVKYYYNGDVLLDIAVNPWQEYVYALKNSDSILIRGNEYSVQNITMVHNTNTAGKGLIIELHVSVERI